jgi:hypothetical protein
MSDARHAIARRVTDRVDSGFNWEALPVESIGSQVGTVPT